MLMTCGKTTAFLVVALCGIVAEASVVRCSLPVKVDGRLDEAVWKTATFETGFSKIAKLSDGKPPRVETAFAVAADDECVYFGIRCREPDTAALKARSTLDAIWFMDAVELFFSPSGSALDYYHFAVAYQNGVRMCSYRAEGGTIEPDPYSAPWRSAVFAGADYWSCEVAIPFASLYMTRNANWKSDWLVNVSRIDRHPPCEWSSWCKLEMGAHEPTRFRRIGGFPTRRISEDVYVKGAVADIRSREGGRYVGELACAVKVAEGGSFEVSSPFLTTTRVELAAGDNDVRVPCSYAEAGRTATPLVLRRLSDGTVVARDFPVIVDYAPVSVRLTTPAYRNNFYPGQNSDVVAGRVVSSVGGAVTVTLEGPGFKAQRQTVGADGTFCFDTRGFTVGRATLTAMAGAERKTVFVRRLAPSGHRMSWIENGHLVVDGRPCLRRNLFADLFMGGEAFKRRYLADSDRHMTPEMTRGGTFEPFRLVKGIEQKEAVKDVVPSPELFAAIDKVLADAKDKDFGYWYMSDEPECRGVSPVYLKHIYDYVTERDPYHVIMTATRGGPRYIDCADWFETHPYLSIYHDDKGVRRYGNEINRIGDFVEEFAKLNRPDKCIGLVPTLFSYKYRSSSCDYPDFDELRCHTWAGMIRGGKTVAPYAYHDANDRAALYEGFKYLFASFEALQDFVLDGTRTTLLRTADCEAVAYDLKGERLLVIVNMSARPQSVRLSGAEGALREFRGSRVFARLAKGGVRTLELKPHETLLATSVRRDAGLPTLAETREKIACAEAERLGRDNQILGREDDVDVSFSRAYWWQIHKLMDGVRDNIGWYSSFESTKHVELSFPKFTPVFERIAVYGHHVGDLRVKVRERGDWVVLTPVKTERSEFGVKLEFGRAVRTVKLRLEFPVGGVVELYEIELPRAEGAAAEAVRKDGASARTPAVGEDILWRTDGTDLKVSDKYSLTDWFGPGVDVVAKDGGLEVRGRSVHALKSDAAHSWLVFDLRQVRPLAPSGYKAWQVAVSGVGAVAGCVGLAEPGTYAVRLPVPTAGENRFLTIHTYGLGLEFDGFRTVAEPRTFATAEPEQGKAVLREGDCVNVTAKLEQPCEDLSASVLFCGGNGVSVYQPAGELSLKPADASRSLWKGRFRLRRISGMTTGSGKPLAEIASRQLVVRVMPLGGAEARPLFAAVPASIPLPKP